MRVESQDRRRSSRERAEDERSWATFWYIMIGLAIIFVGLLYLLTHRPVNHHDFSALPEVMAPAISVPISISSAAAGALP